MTDYLPCLKSLTVKRFAQHSMKKFSADENVVIIGEEVAQYNGAVQSYRGTLEKAW